MRNNKTLNRYGTHSKRIFLKKIRTINWQDHELRVYLRVNYRKGFHNEGDYDNEEDLWFAFKVFTEKN